MQLPVDVRKEVVAQGKIDPRVPVPPYPNGTKIEFHFKTTTTTRDGDEVIDDTRTMGRPMNLIIGKQFKLEIWELMLHTMILKQIAKFTVPKKYLQCYPMVSKAFRDTVAGHKAHAHHCCGMMQHGIGYPDLDKLLEKPQDLTFHFDIVDITAPGDYEEESWQMTEHQKLASLPTLQQEGNAMFAKGDYQTAEKKYFEAIARIEQLLLREQLGSDEAKELDAQKVPLLLNYSLCLMKRKEYYEALTHLNTALKMQPTNVKGLYRRGRVHVEVGNWNEAGKDFEDAEKLDPSLKSNLDALRREMEQEQKQKDAVDKEKFKGIFN